MPRVKRFTLILPQFLSFVHETRKFVIRNLAPFKATSSSNSPTHLLDIIIVCIDRSNNEVQTYPAIHNYRCSAMHVKPLRDQILITHRSSSRKHAAVTRAGSLSHSINFRSTIVQIRLKVVVSFHPYAHDDTCFGYAEPEPTPAAPSIPYHDSVFLFLSDATNAAIREPGVCT